MKQHGDWLLTVHGSIHEQVCVRTWIVPSSQSSECVPRYLRRWPMLALMTSFQALADCSASHAMVHNS